MCCGAKSGVFLPAQSLGWLHVIDRFTAPPHFSASDKLILLERCWPMLRLLAWGEFAASEASQFCGEICCKFCLLVSAEEYFLSEFILQKVTMGKIKVHSHFVYFSLWLLEKTMPTSMFSLVYNPLWPGGMLPRMTRGWAALVYPFVMFFSPLSLPVQLLMNEEWLGYFLSLSPSRSKLMQLKDTTVSAGRYWLLAELISATLDRCLIILIRGDFFV